MFHKLQNYVMNYVQVTTSVEIADDSYEDSYEEETEDFEYGDEEQSDIWNPLYDEEDEKERDYTHWEIESEDKEKFRKIFEEVHNRSKISEDEGETVEEVVASSALAPPKNNSCEDCGKFYEDCDCIW